MTPSTRGRGFALAAARALGPAAARFCRLAAPTAGDAAETLAVHAGRLDDVAARTDEARALGRSEPAGVSRPGGATPANGAGETTVPTIDRSWFLAPPTSTSAAGTAHLERLAYGQLVAMGSYGVAVSDDDDDEGVQLLRRTPDEIERVLMALGRRRVALAFVAAPRAGLAQLCARIGEPAASELVAEVRAVKGAGAGHEDVKAAQRALFRGDDGELGGAGGLDEADALFFRVGAAWLGPALGRRGDQLRRLAQRLPRPLGQTLLDEATAFATEAERAAALTQLANTLRGAL